MQGARNQRPRRQVPTAAGAVCAAFAVSVLAGLAQAPASPAASSPASPPASPPAASPPAPAARPVPPPEAAAQLPLPASADLRPRMKEFGLDPRPQGARGTCSIFVTCVAIEFAAGECIGVSARLSPEFLNWAAGQAAKRPSDGNFFHNALAGYEQFGVCTEATMPYQDAFDAAREPTVAAREEAQKQRESLRQRAAVRWIVPWVPNRFGLTPEQFTDVKRVIAAGHPVAAGSAHSRLLVGYRDDEKAPGGGVFVALDSALNRFDDVTYEFVRTQVADAFCIEPRTPTQTAPPSGSAR